VWLATRRAPRLASHPNPAAKCPTYFLTGPKKLPLVLQLGRLRRFPPSAQFPRGAGDVLCVAQERTGSAAPVM